MFLSIRGLVCLCNFRALSQIETLQTKVYFLFLNMRQCYNSLETDFKNPSMANLNKIVSCKLLNEES